MSETELLLEILKCLQEQSQAVNPVQIYTLPQVAKILDVSEASVRRMMDSGTLPYSKIQAQRYVFGSSIIKMIQDNEEKVVPIQKDDANEKLNAFLGGLREQRRQGH